MINLEVEDLQKHNRGDTQTVILARLVFNISIWFIWKQRNGMFPDGTSTHKCQLFQDIVDAILLKMGHTKVTRVPSKQNISIMENCNCKPVARKNYSGSGSGASLYGLCPLEPSIRQGREQTYISRILTGEQLIIVESMSLGQRNIFFIIFGTNTTCTYHYKVPTEPLRYNMDSVS